jgi:hypothetical protein
MHYLPPSWHTDMQDILAWCRVQRTWWAAERILKWIGVIA